MKKTITNNVQITKKLSEIMGHRCGTIYADKQLLLDILGPPLWEENYRDYTEQKVTIIWQVETPRGIVEIRDYWWNNATEWSVEATGRKPALWAKAFCRLHGLTTT